MSMPELILHNGNVITLDSQATIAEAVAIRGGRLVGVGASQELLRHAGRDTRVLDLGGRTALPGFIDAHPHMDRLGLKTRGGVAIAGLTSVAEIVEAVREAAEGVAPGEWIVTMPMGAPPHEYIYLPEQLAEGRFPNRHDLDAAAPNNPVYIRSVWGWWARDPFPSVANSMALARSGITRDTPAPHKVRIDKDANGDPTGIFLEGNFAPILEYTLFKEVPRFTHDDRVASIREGSDAYSAVGTTHAYEGHGLTPAVIRAYSESRELGTLNVRTHAPFSVPTAAMDDRQVADLLYHYAAVAAGRGVGDDLLRVQGVTFTSGDPAVAKHIAACYPYEQWSGLFYQALPFDRLVSLGVEAARLGLRVNVPVSYNVELEFVLSAFEAIDKEVSIRGRRWVAMHVVHATPDQMERIKVLDMRITISPNYMYLFSDRFRLDKLDAEGLPFRELADAGIAVALETDGVPHSLLWAMWEALARWDERAGRRRGEARLSREEVLRLAIQNGHEITWNEDRFGSLEVGKHADVVVLADDPLTCPEDALKDIAVDLTLVGGHTVHQRLSQDEAAPLQDCQLSPPNALTAADKPATT